MSTDLITVFRTSENVFDYKFLYSGRFDVFKYPDEKPFDVHYADDIHYCFNAAYV